MIVSGVDWLVMLVLSVLYIARPSIDLITISITVIICAAGLTLDLFNKPSHEFKRELITDLILYPCMVVACYFVSPFLFRKAMFLIAMILRRDTTILY